MSALLSPCGRYRYRLERDLRQLPLHFSSGFTPKTILWVMLNPSTADATTDDRTIAKCIRFSRRWGFSRLLVGNLFAFRSTDPKNLPRSGDDVTEAIGPDNDGHLLAMIREADLVLCAWGAHRIVRDRDPQFIDRLAQAALEDTTLDRRGLHALKVSKGGYPCHPLYLPETLKPKAWDPYTGELLR